MTLLHSLYRPPSKNIVPKIHYLDMVCRKHSFEHLNTLAQTSIVQILAQTDSAKAQTTT